MIYGRSCWRYEFVAKLPGAISVLSISEKGNLFKSLEINDKIVGKDIPKDVVDLDYTIENIKNLSEFKNKKMMKLHKVY